MLYWLIWELAQYCERN
ncbi:hypothetical protein LINPERPRIM_LOCUS13082 [Linum perenne]